MTNYVGGWITSLDLDFLLTTSTLNYMIPNLEADYGKDKPCQIQWELLNLSNVTISKEKDISMLADVRLTLIVNTSSTQYKKDLEFELEQEHISVYMQHLNDQYGYGLQPILTEFNMTKIKMIQNFTDDLAQFYRMLPLFSATIMDNMNNYFEEKPIYFAKDSNAIIPDLYLEHGHDDYLELNFDVFFKTPDVEYFHETSDWQTYNYEENIINGFYHGDELDYVPTPEEEEPEDEYVYDHWNVPMSDEEYQEALHNAEDAEHFDEREQEMENDNREQMELDEIEWALEDLFNDEYHKIEEEGQILEDEFISEWNDNVPEWQEFEDASWNEKKNQFVWFFNFLFVAVPYGLFIICMEFWNIYTNAYTNKMWVGGNLFLVS